LIVCNDCGQAVTRGCFSCWNARR